VVSRHSRGRKRILVYFEPVERVCGNKIASSYASQNVVIEVNMALTFSGGRVPGGTGSPTSIMVVLHREVAVD